MYSNSNTVACGYREKEDLNAVAATKLEELIAELQGHNLHPFEPALRRIIDGFTYFKINNFE